MSAILQYSGTLAHLAHRLQAPLRSSLLAIKLLLCSVFFKLLYCIRITPTLEGRIFVMSFQGWKVPVETGEHD